MVARLAAEEEKAQVVVALMESSKKEAVEAVPKFKALTEFIEEVREGMVDSYFKGFANCKLKVAEVHPEWDLGGIVLDLIEANSKEVESPSNMAKVAPVTLAVPAMPTVTSLPPAVTGRQEGIGDVPHHPSKGPTTSPQALVSSSRPFFFSPPFLFFLSSYESFCSGVTRPIEVPLLCKRI